MTMFFDFFTLRKPNLIAPHIFYKVNIGHLDRRRRAVKMGSAEQDGKPTDQRQPGHCTQLVIL